MSTNAPVQVTVGNPHAPNRVLHIILSFLTVGLWLIVWAILEHRAKKKWQRDQARQVKMQKRAIKATEREAKAAERLATAQEREAVQ